jgi:hypothetical protein
MKTLFIISFLFVLIHPGFSQVDENTRFAARVKQLEDFIHRFNFQTDILGNPITDISNVTIELNSNKIKFSKYQLIKFLFNSEKIITNEDSLFIQEICKKTNPEIISFYDDNWYAVTKCNVTYNNKAENLDLSLMNEVYPGHKSKWVICGSDANFLNVLQKAKDSLSILSPISNDLNFQELTKAFNQPDNLSQFFEKNTKLAQFPVLAALMKSKQIKFNNVKNIVYHFLQIDGWIFTVDFYNREQGNSGWLISEVKQCTKEEKQKYKTEKLHLIKQ